MTKQEFIKQSYGEHWESVKDYVDENGWFKMDYDIENVFANQFVSCCFESYEKNLPYGIRPSSLKGLETNNGWIKIESEKDLPKEHMSVFLFEPIDGIGIGSWCNLQMIFKTRFGNEYKPVTHYQPIIKPQKPLY